MESYPATPSRQSIPTPYMTASEVAELAEVSNQTVRNWHKAGVLNPAFTTSTGIHMYARDTVETFAAERAERKGGK